MGNQITGERAGAALGNIPEMAGGRLIAPTGAPRTRFDEVPRYAEGLYEVGEGLYAWMVPNGSWGESNAGLIVGDGEALLVDTLWDIPCTRAMLDAMAPFTENAPIGRVANTHADGDHFWGNQLLSGVEIVATRECFEESRRVLPRSMRLLGTLGRVLEKTGMKGPGRVGHWLSGMVRPYDFKSVTPAPATRTFQGELTLRVGGREVRLMGVGPAHTEGDMMVYVPDAGILYTGDILFVESTPVIWAGPVENWIGVLDRILAMDVATIVPGHGPVTDKEGVRMVREYWKYVQGHAERSHGEGLSARAAARALALGDDFAGTPFARWNSPERVMTNMHTIYRHLDRRKGHPKVPELVTILCKQALLAHELPHAQPASMRKEVNP